jgi:membrane peptidoglycan carboxypeptidase
MEAIAQTIERFGIMNHTPREWSMALGTGETTPLRLTAAYAMLVNGGKRVTPTFIDRIQDRNGATIYRADKRPCDDCTDVPWQHQPMPIIPDGREQVADRVRPSDRHVLQGVARARAGPRRWATIAERQAPPTFSRCGFVGSRLTSRLAVYRLRRPGQPGDDETADTAPIFKDFMKAALKRHRNCLSHATGDAAHRPARPPAPTGAGGSAINKAKKTGGKKKNPRPRPARSARRGEDPGRGRAQWNGAGSACPSEWHGRAVLALDSAAAAGSQRRALRCYKPGTRQR